MIHNNSDTEQPQEKEAYRMNQDTPIFLRAILATDNVGAPIQF